MWSTIGRWAVKLAVYALSHPDQVKAVADAVKAAKHPK
jgi:hypothetical protein